MPVLAILQNAQHYDVYTAISGCPTSHMVPCTTEGIGCNGQYNCGTGCRYAYSEVGGGPNNTVHVTYALAPTTMLTNDSDCSTVLSWNIGALNDYRNPVCITPLEFAVECPVPVTSSPATLRPTTHAPELPKIPAVVFVVIVLSSLCACSLLIGGVFMLECRRVGDARGSYRQLQTP